MNEQSVDISLLNYFKDLYSGHKIIYVRFSNTDFVFRSLNRKEFKYIMSQHSDKIDLEDAICNAACLYPEEYEFETCGFAGLNEYVADIIQELSGFSDIQTVLNEYNHFKEQVNLETQCMDLIKAFIPEYTYDEMQEWTWQKLMEMTARAERVAALRGFDWHIEDKSKEYAEGLSEIDIENPKFIEELKQNGIDPMFYFADELKDIGKHEILDFPLIGGTHWQNEEILNVIREQIAKKKASIDQR